MSESDQQEFKAQLNRIERCLAGDTAMGQVGLVAQINSHEARLSRIERLALYAAGASGAVVVIYNLGLAIMKFLK